MNQYFVISITQGGTFDIVVQQSQPIVVSISQNTFAFTPENVANKSLSIVTDQASNIKYPSVKAVYDWATSVFTTASAVASQITAALVGYATEAWVQSQGYLTSIPTLQQVTDAGNSTTNTINVDSVAFDLTPTAAPGAGQIAYKANTGALAYLMNSSAVESTIGQTMHAYVHNADSVTITKGQAVYLFSASGNKASVKLANNTSDATSAKTFGLAAENIAPNNNGFIICQGVLDGLNLGAYNAGDTLYLGATAGSYTAVKPYAPNHLVYIGIVERANNGNGQIYVKVQNGYELDEIHDVDLISVAPVNNDILTYVTGTPNLWKPRSIGTILGYTPVNPTRSISTTSPLSGGGDLSADRTISIADAAADGTTKGAATFTANDFDSLAGVISLDYTNGQKATALLPGFLSAADWSTFNGKQDNIIKLVKLGVDQTTTSTTAQSDTELTTSALEANKTYAIYGRLRVGNNGAGGSRLGWNLPSGATGNVAIFAPTSSLTAFQIGGSNNSVLSTVSFTQNLTSNAYIMGSFTMGATVGTTNLIFASGTSGQTTTILGSGGSFAILIKMN